MLAVEMAEIWGSLGYVDLVFEETNTTYPKPMILAIDICMFAVM